MRLQLLFSGTCQMNIYQKFSEKGNIEIQLCFYLTASIALVYSVSVYHYYILSMHLYGYYRAGVTEYMFLIDPFIITIMGLLGKKYRFFSWLNLVFAVGAVAYVLERFHQIPKKSNIGAYLQPIGNIHIIFPIVAIVAITSLIVHPKQEIVIWSRMIKILVAMSLIGIWVTWYVLALAYYT